MLLKRHLIINRRFILTRDKTDKLTDPKRCCCIYCRFYSMDRICALHYVKARIICSVINKKLSKYCFYFFA